MPNDYGIFKAASPTEWLKTELPVTWSSADQAIKNYSFPNATAVATYLTNTEGFECRVGRPDDRHPH
jgi:hypothetical protein